MSFMPPALPGVYDSYKFETEDQNDIVSLILRRKKWIIEMNKTYGLLAASLLNKIELPTDYSPNPTNLKTISDEYGAIVYTRQSFLKIFGYEENKTRVLESIYDLILLKKNNTITNEARVAGLWMRDKAFIENPNDIDNAFPKVFKEYKKRIGGRIGGCANNKLATYGTRISLARKAFTVTNECIKNVEVLKIHSSNE